MTTEVSVILRYRFGSISIDLIKHSAYFRNALKIKGSVIFLHMNGTRLQQFLREHVNENAEFAKQLKEIQEKFSVVKPGFSIIDDLTSFDEGEFIYNTPDVVPARNFTTEAKP